MKKAILAVLALTVASTLPLGAQCAPQVAQHPIEGADHLTPCDPTPYNTNPPSSGNHYYVWAAFRTYDSPVAPGFLVHDLEHGAIVIGYNCPAGCASDVAALQAWIDHRPVDPACSGASVDRRIILAPNPNLDVKFAAAAWGWTWKAACVDTASLSAFAGVHYAKGPEDLCGGGAPDAATLCPVLDVAPQKALPETAPGFYRLWTGSLERRTTLRIEVTTADGKTLEATQREAGPGETEAVWDGGPFLKRHARSGTLYLRVTAGVRSLASIAFQP